MRKICLCILLCLLVASVLVGCGDETTQSESQKESQQASQMASQLQAQNTSSAREKDEVELVVEKTAWQIDESTSFLLFGNERVTEYDLSVLDGETQEIGKFLSYKIDTDEQNNKSISIESLVTDEPTVFVYNRETKTFETNSGTKMVLKSVSMKSFVDQYMRQIEKVQDEGGEKWGSQAEMNVGSGTICCYWNALHEAVNTHLKTVLSAQEYEMYLQDNKAFLTARDAAMQEAGKDVEGGSLYPVVTNGAYSTETKKRMDAIVIQYFTK